MLAFVNVCEALVSHRNMLSVAKVYRKEDKCNSSVLKSWKMHFAGAAFQSIHPVGNKKQSMNQMIAILCLFLKRMQALAKQSNIKKGQRLQQ